MELTDLLYCCRFLTEVKFQKPVIVYNYPKGIKAFYMRLNDDSKTVAAMDVLVPKVAIFLSKILSSSSFGMVLLCTITLLCCVSFVVYMFIFFAYISGGRVDRGKPKGRALRCYS